GPGLEKETYYDLSYTELDRLGERGGELMFSGMPSSLPSQQDLRRYMVGVGLIGEQGGGLRVFDTRDEGLEWMENRILEEAGGIEKTDERTLDLKDIELMREMDDATIEALRSCMREKTVAAGNKIFALGDSGDELFLIRRGTVRILLPLKGGKYHHLATFRPGDYFGEMAFLDHLQRSADAVAKTDCELYMLSRREFNARVYDDAVLGVRVFARVASAISERLRQTDRELSVLEER
ncbi:MAG: cyclic nucleotide-binding domain-containing protein, partial [Methylomonas sp.]|nr:cyclic nucleotide-binding domain-containing protein [Methylomonas sp.]